MSTDSVKEVDAKLSLVKFDDFGDWYSIERAEHDNKHWMEDRHDAIGNYSACMYSGRISDADIEGTATEMSDIADAIKKRTAFDAKRCAVDATGERALLYSPRNSHCVASVPMARADELARQIEKELG